MEHIAILNKKWNVLPKLLNGTKTIESRWYRNRSAPWDAIAPGEIVYFKNSGEPVTVQAAVSHVLQYEDLNRNKITEILTRYGCDGQLSMEQFQPQDSFFTNKRYCILVFLKKVKKIEPFAINKTGYGNAAAWIGVESVGKLKINR
jgi:hypothetical protein